MIRFLCFSLLLAAALAVGAEPLFAQSSDLLVAQASDAVATQNDVVAQVTPGGIPERPPAPRTLREYWHLFLAYAVAWVLVFGYVIHLGRRFGRIEEELQRYR